MARVSRERKRTIVNHALLCLVSRLGTYTQFTFIDLHLTSHTEQNRHICVTFIRNSHAHSSSGQHQPLAAASAPVTPPHHPPPSAYKSQLRAHRDKRRGAHRDKFALTTRGRARWWGAPGAAAFSAARPSALPPTKPAWRPPTHRRRRSQRAPTGLRKGGRGRERDWCERPGVRLRGEGRARAVRSAARRVARQNHSRRILGSLRTTLLYIWIPTPAVAPDIIVTNASYGHFE